jgi:DNA-binding FadR family transcriptional regulator
MMHVVVEAFMPITNMVVYHVRDRSTVVGFHDELVQAIEARDAPRAVSVLESLLDYLRHSYGLALARRAERRP